MATQVKQKAGRKYAVDGTGISSLSRDYLVIQDDVMAANGEVVTFDGVPAIGTPHPNYPGLVVHDYEVQEGSGSDKKVLTVTVNYAPIEYEEIPNEGGEEEADTCAVDEWGWDDGTDERELTSGVDGTDVRNSAGDPFESVPRISVPAPTFTKVMRFKTRQSDWADYRCKVNQAKVTIGGVDCAACTLLCTVGEKRIFGNQDWKYQYTVHLKYKSNIVTINNSGSPTEIGWDVAIADAGMREKDPNTGEKKLIRVMDKETGKMCSITSATLLDGSGQKNQENYSPYNFRFQAYERTTFPSWFYSEPDEKKPNPLNPNPQNPNPQNPNQPNS